MAQRAYEMPRTAITITPAIDFSSKRYTFVTINSDGQLATPTAGAPAIGILQTPGIAGEPCNVMTEGISFVIYGGTVAAGDAISVGADGKAVKATALAQDGTSKVVTEATSVTAIAIVGGDANDIGCCILK